MVKRVILCAFLICTIPAFGGITLVQREPFQTVGTLTNGTTGNLGTIATASQFWKRAVGPRVTNDTSAASLGWSADLHQGAGNSATTEHTISLSNPALTNGMFLCWYWVDRLVIAGTNPGYFVKCQTSGALRFIELFFKPSSNGNFWYNVNAGDVDSTVAIPIRQWFQVQIYWRLISGTTYSEDIAYRLAGSGSWVQIFHSTSQNPSRNIGQVTAGLANSLSASLAVFNGRYGMPSIYSATGDGDQRPTISDVADPPITATSWYVNPSTGSDTNDGVTTSTPWRSVVKVNAESLYSGLFSSTAFSTGDSLYFDTSSAQFDLSVSNLVLTTGGLNVAAVPGNTWINCLTWINIPSNQWTTVSGLPAVYTTTNTISVATLWENDKWLTHPNGSTLASVSNALQTTAGSFWTSSTNLYVHPFGNTDPRSDGKTYDRSNIPGVAFAISLSSSNMNVRDFYTRKTCDVAAVDGTPNGGYGIGTGSVWSGTNQISHCYIDYFGKHGLGLVANSANNEYTTVTSVQCEQGSPYGSQTPFVSFTASTPTNITHIYKYCTVNNDAGLVGSTNGTSGFAGAFYCHNNSGFNQFGLIRIENCYFNQSPIGATDAALSMVISNTVFGGDTGISAATKTFSRCLITRYLPIAPILTGTVVIADCIYNLTNAPAFNDNTCPVRGTNTIKNCTFDLRSAVSVVNNPGVSVRTALTTFTNFNNVYLFPTYTGASANDWTVYKNFTNTDTIVSFNNFVFLRGQTAFADNYAGADKTLSQWQALGFDAATVTNNPCLSANFRPYAKTPTWVSGSERGPAIDYSGKTFQSRRTAGAYEYSGYTFWFQP